MHQIEVLQLAIPQAFEQEVPHEPSTALRLASTALMCGWLVYVGMEVDTCAWREDFVERLGWDSNTYAIVYIRHYVVLRLYLFLRTGGLRSM